MNIKEKLACNYCHEVSKHQINLICCGKRVCKQHIDELVNENPTNKFSCPVCLQENSNQNFHCDELIESLVEMELHKFKLNPKYEIVMNNFKLEIQELESILKEPENIIYEEIRELKRLVDLDRENLKIQIDTLADGLIQRLETYEKKFKAEYNSKIDFDKYAVLVESSKNKLKEFEKCLNLFSVEKEERDEKTSEIEKTTEHLRPKINNLKQELFSNLTFTYEPMAKNTDELFGKLIVEENQKQFLGNLKKELKGHTSFVLALLPLENGDLISGSNDQTIRIWDTTNGTLKKILTGHSGGIRDLKIVGNNRLISASDDKTIKIWNISNGKVERTLTSHTERVLALNLLKNGDLVSGSGDETIKIWDINEGTLKKTLTGHTDEVWALVLLENGDLVSGSADKTLKIWDLNAGTVKRTLSGHTDYIYVLELLANGDLVSGSNDKTIKIWDTEDGTCKRTLTGHTSYVFALKQLDNGDLASGSPDKTIKIWNLVDGTIKKSLINKGSVYALESLANGDLVSSCSHNYTIKIWE